MRICANTAGGCWCAAAIRSRRCRRSSGRSTRGRCTSAPTSARTASRGTRRSRQRSATCRSFAPARRTRSARAASARPTATRSRSTRRSTGPGWTTAGGRPPRRSPAGSTGTPRSTASTSRPTRGCRRTGAARGRRGSCARPGGRTARTHWPYADDRDRPDLDRTSHMSVYLKWGSIHPRTLLADLGPGDETYRRELAWREFYAAVLHDGRESAREYFQPQIEADALRAAHVDDVGRLAGGPHRLPDRRCRDAPAARRRAGCTTGSA